MQSNKRSGDLAVPNEPGQKCPLGHVECLEDRCALYEELEDWQGCGLRLVEAVIKEVMRDGARWLDDLLGLSSKGPK